MSNLVDNLSELKIKEIDNDVLIKRFYNTYQLRKMTLINLNYY